MKNTKALGDPEEQHRLTIDFKESITLTILFSLCISSSFPIILAHTTFSRITIGLYNRNNSFPIVGIGSFTVNRMLLPFIVKLLFHVIVLLLVTMQYS